MSIDPSLAELRAIVAARGEPMVVVSPAAADRARVFLSDLPIEVLVMILEYGSGADMAAVACTSRLFAALAMDNLLWKVIFERRWGRVPLTGLSELRDMQAREAQVQRRAQQTPFRWEHLPLRPPPSGDGGSPGGGDGGGEGNGAGAGAGEDDDDEGTSPVRRGFDLPLDKRDGDVADDGGDNDGSDGEDDDGRDDGAAGIVVDWRTSYAQRHIAECGKERLVVEYTRGGRQARFRPRYVPTDMRIVPTTRPTGARFELTPRAGATGEIVREGNMYRFDWRSHRVRPPDQPVQAELVYAYSTIGGPSQVQA